MHETRYWFVFDSAPNELGATFIFEYIIEVRNAKIKIKNVKHFTFCFSINKNNNKRNNKTTTTTTKRSSSF